MQTLTDVEAALKRLQQEGDEIRSRQFREMLQALIADQREILKTLRGFYN
jgi:hypothetical protein